MIPEVRDYLKRLEQEWEGMPSDGTESLLPDDEMNYLRQIKTVEDLLNYTDDGSGRFCALAYDIALAMGLTLHDAGAAANDI